ncbi:MAG: S9 family peptidase [Methylobacteriaceae bacterium]|nr:S9 family peptidase [Methylobacteriaceae bacterium]
MYGLRQFIFICAESRKSAICLQRSGRTGKFFRSPPHRLHGPRKCLRRRHDRRWRAAGRPCQIRRRRKISDVATSGSKSSVSIPPPIVERRPRRTRIHGVDLVDDYAWLRAENWREALRDPSALDPAIRAALEAENAYSGATLAPLDPLVADLAAEMRGRIREDESSPPAPDGAYAYYTRFRKGGQYPLICRMPRGGGAETLLLDGDALARGAAFFQLGPLAASPDHARIAWSSDDKGAEYFTIRVRDAATGRDAEDRVERAEGDIVWSAAGEAFYYVALDDNHRPSRVFRHRLGEPQSADQCVFEERDPRWFVSLHRTRSRRFAVIALHDHDSAEAHLVELADPRAVPRLVAARRPGLRYDVEHHGERLIIRTDADGAIDFKLVEASLAAPDRWRDLVPHRPGCFIVAHETFRDFLVRLERANATPRLVVTEFASGAEHDIAFDEEAYALGFERMREYDSQTLRFSYSSLTRPREIWDYDMRTRARVLLKRQEIPSGHDPDRYVARRIHAVAADGARVPISLFHRRDLPPDGSAPALLYGYGAYGSSIPAAFSANRLSLVDRGFVYAIAHVRGGSDLGWGWYLDGKLEKKTNTFGDFIAAARALTETGYAAPGRIVAQGGSAGGMLMGAVANSAPELFAGIIADVPFVDVVNTMLDGELPLTPPEWREWGDPRRDEAAFRRMLAYSPYDNVRAQIYPPILALAGLCDPRVTYWEPAKWVARLRATMTGGGPALLHVNMAAGHGGASGRFDRLGEVALQYAFALACARGDFAAEA